MGPTPNLLCRDSADDTFHGRRRDSTHALEAPLCGARNLTLEVRELVRLYSTRAYRIGRNDGPCQPLIAFISVTISCSRFSGPSQSRRFRHRCLEWSVSLSESPLRLARSGRATPAKHVTSVGTPGERDQLFQHSNRAFGTALA
jgi:hypothetical protein